MKNPFYLVVWLSVAFLGGYTTFPVINNHYFEELRASKPESIIYTSMQADLKNAYEQKANALEIANACLEEEKVNSDFVENRCVCQMWNSQKTERSLKKQEICSAESHVGYNTDYIDNESFSSEWK